VTTPVRPGAATAPGPATVDLRQLGTVPALDGLRGLAVLLVMMVHLQLLLPFEQTGIGAIDGFIRGGYLGVDLFFVLSGFLITALLLNEMGGTGWIRFGAFYIRRALRLLPALYVLLAAHVIYAQLNDLPARDEYLTVRAAVLYMSNWQVVIDPTVVAHELTQLWSLAIEEQFYLWWPAILVSFLGPRRSARTVGLLLGGAILAVAVWRYWLLNEGAVYWTELTVRTDTRVDALLIGALLASLWVRRATPERGVDGAAWAALIVLFGCVAVFRGPDDIGYEGGLTVFALAVGVVVLALVNGTWGGRWFFEIRPLRAVGRVSYGLYLWHYPIFYAVGIHGTDLSNRVRVATALALTTVATLGSWYLVERPALRLKSRFGAHTAPDPGRTLAPAPEPARVPLPGWYTPRGPQVWAAVGVVLALAAVGVVRLTADDPTSPGAVRQPDGLAFPTGDADRVGYWGLVDLTPTLIDNFGRGDDPASLTTADTGQPWSTVSGTWGVEGEAAFAAGLDGDAPAVAVLEQAHRDGLTEVTLTTIAEGAGLVVRYEDPGNYWSIVAHPGTGTWTVAQVTDGEAVPAGEFSAPTVDDTTISVTQNGTTIRVLIDGAEYLTLQDIPLEAPYRAGLVATSEASLAARWDRYLIMAFESTGATG